MKKIIAIVSLFVSVLMVGCFDPNAFDFSRLQNVEAEGTWGIPVINAKYTIGDILAMADNPDFLTPGDDGVLEINYEFTKDSVIAASEYLDTYFNDALHLSGSETMSIGSLPLPVDNIQTLFTETLSFEFPEDKLLIERAALKSGFVTVVLNYNVMAQVEVKLTCGQLTNSAGQAFHSELSASGGHYEQTFDFSGYTLNVQSDNKVEIDLEVSCVIGSSLPSTIEFNYDVSFNKVLFSEVRGKFATVTVPVENTWEFDLQYIADHFAGTMTVLDPKVTCEIMNTFPIDANIVVQDATLSGPGISSSILSSTPATIYVPGSTGQYAPVQLPLASAITLSPSYRHFNLEGDVSVNPGGMNTPTLVLREDQLINLRIKIVLPLKMQLNHLTFSDTIDFSGLTVPEEPAFSNLLLRLGLYNGLPLSFAAQAYFYDSQTRTIKDSLFTSYQMVDAAVNGEPVLTELFVSKKDLHVVQEMLTCDQIIIKAMLNTDGRSAAIRSDQTLKVELGAQFNMDVNVLVNN